MKWNSADLKLTARANAMVCGADGRAHAGHVPANLHGKRILVVEDEMLLALDLEEGLLDAGCIVVGPAGSLTSAMRFAEAESIDAAILDVNLAGQRVFPVAQTLMARGVPFLFATAYATTDDLYPADVKAAPRIAKPYTVSQAVATLRHLISA